MLAIDVIRELDSRLDEFGVSIKMDLGDLRTNSEILNRIFRDVYHEMEIPFVNIIYAIDPYTPVEKVVDRVLDVENRRLLTSELNQDYKGFNFLK